MTASLQINRRRENLQGYRLAQPAFIQFPKTVAAFFFVGVTLLVLAANHLTGSTIWYGPVYLLICAFSAWYVATRFAVTLGLFILVIQGLSGQVITVSRVPGLINVNLALQFCSALAIVLMLGVARKALEIEWKYARIDPLTGALNRKAFFEAVEANADRTSQAVLVYADLDGLKLLNDGLGHEVGDVALRNFADRVRSAIRKDDLFARIGGDEFVILLNVRNGVAAKAVADRLHKVLNLEADGDQATLKCSMGVLLLPAGSSAIDDELKLADSLMYHAKKERSALVMGWSVKGNAKRIIRLAPETTADGFQRSAVTSEDRHLDSMVGANAPDESQAA